ncbi:unnamed protein product [Polarella glacialis]|uniref:Uncharacterized protein n=1 Tax=Polarella glacialis TaxID=89957 RepID=A0A813I348_POLGL|nr:unnamed protein product [Polarella glacialis]
MPRRVHSDINWVCPRTETWSASGLKKFGIERRRIIHDLRSPPQMPSAAGSNSAGSAGACHFGQGNCAGTNWMHIASCDASKKHWTTRRDRHDRMRRFTI